MRLRRLSRTRRTRTANIIFGAVLDERMGDEVKITVIATGFRSRRCRSGGSGCWRSDVGGAV